MKARVRLFLTFAFCLLPFALTTGARQAPVQTAAQAIPPEWQDVIRNLRHPDVKPRLASLEQLANAGYTAAADYVAPLVTDPDDRVQFAAIDAELTFFLVESIGERRVFSLSGASKSRAQEAFDAGLLVRAAWPAPLIVIDNLATAMRDENSRVRFDAVHAIGVIGEAPLPAAQAKALMDGLDHYDPIMRAATARVLGRLRVKDAGDKLIAALNDSNKLVRRYAAIAIGQLRDERAVDSLTQLAEYYRKDELAGAMLAGLARIAHASSLDLFRSRLSDADPQVRRACAEGLGRLRDRQSLERLTTMAAKDSAADARLAATFAVGLIDQPQSHVIAAALGSADTALQASEYLIELGATAVPGVQAALGVAKDTTARANLLHVLGFIAKPADVSSIEPFTREKDERVTRAATDAIARIRRG